MRMRRLTLTTTLLGLGGILLSPVQANVQPAYYLTPSYSNFTVGYTQAAVDDVSDTVSDVHFRFEQVLRPNMYLSASYYDFNETVDNHPVAMELEDMQLGLGWFNRSDVGPYVDASVLIGRETLHVPASNADNTMFSESDYFGVQLGLRETHGPLEAQAGVAYLFHDGDRDDQLRWYVGAQLSIWRNFSIGLRYQDNDQYSLRSVELRFRW